MSGGLPKDPRLIQRRSRKPGNALLEGERLGRLPGLPRRDDGQPWHRLTRMYWRDLGRSPMMAEFVRCDLYGLLMVAELTDRYWRTGEVKYAVELRQQRQCFGLDDV